MNYLELCNKVIQESASEIDELTLLTWSSAEAGRRLYPRIKRLVAEAWKMIQIERNEWEFKTTELSTVVYPRLKFQNGSRTAGAPPVGSVFIGQTSGFKLTVRQVLLKSGAWLDGDAEGQIEFDTFEGSQLVPAETFAEFTPILNDGEFIYLEKGSYDFRQVDPLLREIHWTTMVAQRSNSTPIPVIYIPWENWMYEEASFTQGSITPPAYYSQDFEGNVVFYPQTLNQFRVTFVYDIAPQALILPTDVPSKIPAEYHEWIAWNALMNLAKFDKNPDLAAYARSMATPYKLRAERNLMPIPSWAQSRYNDPALR